MEAILESVSLLMNIYPENIPQTVITLIQEYAYQTCVACSKPLPDAQTEDGDLQLIYINETSYLRRAGIKYEFACPECPTSIVKKQKCVMCDYFIRSHDFIRRFTGQVLTNPWGVKFQFCEHICPNCGHGVYKSWEQERSLFEIYE